MRFLDFDKGFYRSLFYLTLPIILEYLNSP